MAKKTEQAEKTSVKSVKTTVGSKELRAMDTKALAAALVETQKDLADARRSLVAGELVNPQVIGRYRKQIARIKTVMIENVTKASVKEDA